MRHTFIHENMIDYLRSYRYDAHPMGMLVSSVAVRLVITLLGAALPLLSGNLFARQ